MAVALRRKDKDGAGASSRRSAGRRRQLPAIDDSFATHGGLVLFVLGVAMVVLAVAAEDRIEVAVPLVVMGGLLAVAGVFSARMVGLWEFSLRGGIKGEFPREVVREEASKVGVPPDKAEKAFKRVWRDLDVLPAVSWPRRNIWSYKFQPEQLSDAERLRQEFQMRNFVRFFLQELAEKPAPEDKPSADDEEADAD